MKYEVIIYWSQPDNAFIAEIPELTGCMANGSTKPKSLAAVETIANNFGHPIPTPKGKLFAWFAKSRCHLKLSQN